MTFGRHGDAFDPQKTPGTKSWNRAHGLRPEEGPEKAPGVTAGDFETWCAEQQERILTAFALRDLVRAEQRWVEGQWVGRAGLERVETHN